MKLAVCCAMNQNRSMEAHSLLKKRGHQVSSFGTNKVIRIPGPTISQPNIFTFDHTYREIYNDLISKDPELYRSIGMLHILERNMAIKEKPENFFAAVENGSDFDLVITCDKKCFWSIYDEPNIKTGFWLVNFDIKDTPHDALCGAGEICEFVEMIEKDVEKALENYCKEKNKEILFCFLMNDK